MTEPPATNQPLHHAHTLAQCGLRVIPIHPGGKHPPVAAWQKAATTNPDTINNWWTGPYTGHGIGIALGTQPDGRHIFALDLDRHNPNADGHHTLQQLQQTHGPLPATVTAHTGGNGTHHLYQAPHDTIIRNQRADGGTLGPGIDIRGQGGQIVAPPTTHPNGNPYQWAPGHAPWQHPIAHAPQWLINLITTPPATQPTPPPTTTTTIGGDTPADQLRNHWDWPTELAAAGWTHHHTDPNGDQHWTRPGKHPREGSSAVHHPGGPLVIFTTNIPTHWQQHGTPTIDGTGRSYTPFEFYACTRHQGNLTEAHHTLKQRYQPDTPLDDLIRSTTTSSISGVTGTISSEETDRRYDELLLEQLINWDEFWEQDHSAEDWLVEPVLAARRSHAIYAPGGTGKSLFSLWLAAKVATGSTIFGRTIPPKRILYLDYEMTADDLAERLDSIGIDNPDTLNRLHYALLPALPAADTAEGGLAICRLAELVNAEVVIIDTFGRAVAGDENDADTVRNFYRLTGSRLKREGRAFVRIDHAGKDLAKGQRGSSAKNDDVDVVWQLTKTDNGITLKAQKRRMGWVPETVEMTLTDDPLTYDMTIRPGYPAGTAEAIRLLDELDIDPELSARKTAHELRERGHTVGDRVLRAAVKIRKERLEGLVKSAAKNPCRGEKSKTMPRATPHHAAPPTNPPKTLENTHNNRGTQNDAAVCRGDIAPMDPAAPPKGAAGPGPTPQHPPQPVDNQPPITLEDL